ncbi:glycine betaine/carnitine/choline transport system permease protein OpuCB [Weizmannia acidilactici]|uniref:Glycine betaine/carnitine/choline transport system permease protein OpuCB n=1 Tax=Weizmannia acidilactici TaxID=2607726 RepID=A0A5J4JLC6_9BACI|nr:ABC transporter permease [Weizmannia acidilactici]GER69794.1 glycine betaine/carnitine/choline transport system permease protein OpuCB [Weizmannia acidilactici]GER73658.1 glycine betaine/carnitine/choline transport system permease protein OpuCB [Weizmannia acidilactici]
MDAFMQFMASNWNELLLKTWQHFYISMIAVILGIFVAVPLGIWLTKYPKAANIVMGIAGVIQTFPSLAILAFFIPVLGVGKLPAIAALFFYSVLPILRNTYTGVKGIDPNLLEAGRGMGMTGWERILHVELPLSTPVIMAGIRLSTVYLIGWATLASFIGAGGLGDYIFSGLNLYQPAMIVVGAVPVTLLALIVDYLLGKLENFSTPKGIRKQKQAA